MEGGDGGGGSRAQPDGSKEGIQSAIGSEAVSVDGQ